MFVETTKAATVVLALVLPAVLAYDKYEDAMKKYLHWQQKYAKYSSLPSIPDSKYSNLPVSRLESGTRPQRHVGPHLQRQDTETRPIFLPHRPSDGGKQFSVDEVTRQTNLLGLAGLELYNPDLVRGSRAPEELAQTNEVTLPGSEYLSYHSGTPLYKIRKKYPLGYGRRKREAQNIFQFSKEDNQNIFQFSKQENSRFPQENRNENRPRQENRPRPIRQTGWTLLDPATGRPIENKIKDDFFEDPLNRNVRRPSQAAPETFKEHTHWEDNEGKQQPIYKYYKRNPFGYSG
jgi:hypothetical protein